MWVQLTDRTSLGALDSVLRVVATYPGSTPTAVARCSPRCSPGSSA
ncbi:hypothetical protein G7085_06325 [Tessaracoccus sp. HDW20]|nr:hypothetical protein [Tessaracoccus coleopterorum]NHB84347.1 hypothetical protein [Tessaracoccus coleopterorum]